jgi:hypothetical protein
VGPSGLLSERARVWSGEGGPRGTRGGMPNSELTQGVPFVLRKRGGTHAQVGLVSASVF